MVRNQIKYIFLTSLLFVQNPAFAEQTCKKEVTNKRVSAGYTWYSFEVNCGSILDLPITSTGFAYTFSSSNGLPAGRYIVEIEANDKTFTNTSGNSSSLTTSIGAGSRYTDMFDGLPTSTMFTVSYRVNNYSAFKAVTLEKFSLYVKYEFPTQIIDNEDASFFSSDPIVLLHDTVRTPIVVSNNTWQATTDGSKYINTNYLSIPTGEGNMNASWSFISEQTGHHDVCVSVPDNNHDLNTNATYTLRDEDGESKIVINQNSEIEQWACFDGYYNFVEGKTYSIQLSDEGDTSTQTLADAIRIRHIF
jgi:hypothetical protein